VSPHCDVVEQLDDGQVGQRPQLLQVVLLEGLQEDGLQHKHTHRVAVAAGMLLGLDLHMDCLHADGGTAHTRGTCTSCISSYLAKPTLAVELAAISLALNNLQDVDCQMHRHVLVGSAGSSWKQLQGRRHIMPLSSALETDIYQV
jgi:hypothetical protein